MSATTTHSNTATNEAQFLAPETHQRAGGDESVPGGFPVPTKENDHESK